MATKYPEYPEMYPDVNAGTSHLLLNLLVDLSVSMSPSMEKLRDALALLESTLKANEKARTSVEIAIICFNDSVQYTPHMPLEYMELPNIVASGCTSLHEALEVAIKLDRERKDFLASKGTGHYRSWTMIFSDGMPTDSDNGRIQKLHEAQKRGSMIVYPVTIGEAVNRDFLASLSIDGSIITATRDNFQNAMVWLTDSVVKVSESKPGDTVMVPNPNDPKYGGIRFQQIPVRA